MTYCHIQKSTALKVKRPTSKTNFPRSCGPFFLAIPRIPPREDPAMPSSGRSSKGALPAEFDSTAWERRVGRHRERRQEEDDLWSRLDDLLVVDASEFPRQRTEPCLRLPPLQLTLRRELLARADGRGVFAQGRLGGPRTGTTEPWRSSQAGRAQSSWKQRLHRRAGCRQ